MEEKGKAVTKICIKCKQEKLLGEFCKHKSKKDGLQSFCRKCASLLWLTNREKYLVKYETFLCKLSSIPLEEIKETLRTSNTFFQAIKKLFPTLVARQSLATMSQVLSKYAKEQKLDYSHFKCKKDLDYIIENRDKVFVFDSKRDTGSLSKLIRENNLIEDNCKICGLKPIWNGMFLKLRLDHIDGNRKNNLLENLRFICPNCDSQTPHYCGRNKGAYQKKESV